MLKLNYSDMFQMLQSNMFQMKEKNVILEPICCIFRMILLNYKNKGTKISITNNSLYYNEPTVYQGMLRSYNGDTREDLHNLYNPFLKAFEWYINDVEDSIYQYFYKECYKGLEKLVSSYEKGSIIHHTLTHYCTMFNDRINHKLVDIKDLEKESPLLNDLKNFWDEDELLIVYQTLQYLEKCKDDSEKNIYFKIIDDIISMKEKKVYEFVEKYSTSYN
jgi:glutathionylspermidine synthase